MYVRMYVSIMYVSMYVHMYVCTYVCMCVHSLLDAVEDNDVDVCMYITSTKWSANFKVLKTPTFTK